MLFSLVLALCEGFPAMTPFSVSRERLHDVVCLFEDLKQNKERKAAATPGAPAGSFMQGGTLYIPAQNDDWY